MHIALANAVDVPESDQDEHLVAAALAAQGVTASVVAWDDPTVDWSSYDAVMIRSTWDYTGRLAEFLAWAEAVEAAGTPLHNSATVVRWNTHKGYLIELEERGAPIVPTAWVAQGDRVDLAELAADRGWDGVVAKPAIGVGSDGLLVVRAGEDPAVHQAAFAALTAAGDTMVQPFIASVVDRGELSVIVLDGRVSHAVRKMPTAGDVRVQIEFGGAYVAEEPTEDAVRLAEWLVSSTGHDLLYARVDLLEDVDGTLLLGELECVEPALMLAWAPGSAERVAAALRDRVAG